MMDFDRKKVEEICEHLAEKGVLFKSVDGVFNVEPEVDFLMRSKIIRKLKENMDGEQAVIESIIEVLLEYGAFKEEGATLGNLLTVKVLLSFSDEKVLKKILKVKVEK